ncbi:hypothetical protein [Bilophila wadsworthia]
MKNAENYLSALCELYTEVVTINLEKGTCRILSTGFLNTLFRNTETFTVHYLDILAQQNVLLEDRKAFCEFFHSENLRSVWRSGAPREFPFSRISGRESQLIVASIVPVAKHSVLCALRFVDHACKVEPKISYNVFLHQFLQILEKLFDVIIELDMETERARVLRTADYGDIGKTNSIRRIFLHSVKRKAYMKKTMPHCTSVNAVEKIRSSLRTNQLPVTLLTL